MRHTAHGPVRVTLPFDGTCGILASMKTTASRGVRIRSNVRGGRLAVNRNAKKLVVRSSVKSGRLAVNHNAR